MNTFDSFTFSNERVRRSSWCWRTSWVRSVSCSTKTGSEHFELTLSVNKIISSEESFTQWFFGWAAALKRWGKGKPIRLSSLFRFFLSLISPANVESDGSRSSMLNFFNQNSRRRRNKWEHNLICYNNILFNPESIKSSHWKNERKKEGEINR